MVDTNLFNWLSNLTEKYDLNEEDQEYITIIFMHASDKRWNKNQVFKKLEKYPEMINPKFIAELFTKFDDLVKNAYRL